MCTFWYLGIALIAIILIFSVVIALKSRLLRDFVSDEKAFHDAAKLLPRFKDLTSAEINELPPPYSLARAQLLVWTVIISCSYVYVMFCLNCDPAVLVVINKTALLLMGISLVTTATASTIDSSQNDDERSQNEPSSGFFQDILSDEKGISMHRFQNVIWTIVAITVYISILLSTHDTPAQLPSLDNTLLVLTGLSSAGYLGLKLGENAEKKTGKTPDHDQN